MSRFATGKSNDLDLLIHGDRGALKIWANSHDSTLETCLGPDIDTQTWTPYPCQPTPAQRGALRHRAPLRRERRARLPPRHQDPELLDLTFVADAEGRMLPVG